MDPTDCDAERAERWDSGAVLPGFSWGVCSDRGPQRDHNEDCALGLVPPPPVGSWERGALFAVADGMGGHAAGEVASRTAIEALAGYWARGSAAVPQALRSAIRAANTEVLDAAFAPGLRGMGTTLTAAVVAGRELVVGHVGDTRAYLIRGRACSQLTNDHSRVAEMLRMRLLTPERAATHPARSQLTRSLGAELVAQVDIVRHDLRCHDVLVLCSDGLWDVVGRSELAAEAGRLVGGEATAQEVAISLVDLANKRDTSDNATAVVVHVSADEAIPPVAARRSLFRRGRG